MATIYTRSIFGATTHSFNILVLYKLSMRCGFVGMVTKEPRFFKEL